MIMKKGYLLIEVLVMLSVIAMTLLIIAGQFRVLAIDVPRAYRDFQSNTSILDMLNKLRNDIEAAQDLSQAADASQDGVETLSIDSVDSKIRYTFENNKVTKTELTDDGYQMVESWSVPRAVINIELWQNDGKTYALEISTAVRRKVWDHWENRLKNSHVFFVKSSGE